MAPSELSAGMVKYPKFTDTNSQLTGFGLIFRLPRVLGVMRGGEAAEGAGNEREHLLIETFAMLSSAHKSEYPGHGPDTRTLQMQACNGLAFFRLQLLVLSSFVHSNTLYETGVALHI
jgi:hypothetical protein